MGAALFELESKTKAVEAFRFLLLLHDSKNQFLHRIVTCG